MDVMIQDCFLTDRGKRCLLLDHRKLSEDRKLQNGFYVPVQAFLRV
jgi:hypothetical protein